MNRRALLTTVVLSAAALSAQERQDIQFGPGAQIAQDRIITVAPPGGWASTKRTFGFVASSSMEGKTVKGAPYSADIVNESTRILADGTRIVSKNTSSVYRDKDGRSRRENSLSPIGPNQNNTEQMPRMVTVTDPVAKELTILDLNEKTARKVKMGEPMIYRTESDNPNRKEIFEHRVDVQVRTREGVTGGAAGVAAGVPAMGAFVAGTPMHAAFFNGNAKTESLGKQVMEGVAVEGTRETSTIAAGEIGNDRDIVTVTERWYSNELQIVVYSKTNDPQFGETIYRTTNIKRADPDPALFKAPAEFKTLEEPEGDQIFKFKKKLDEAQHSGTKVVL